MIIFDGVRFRFMLIVRRMYNYMNRQMRPRGDVESIYLFICSNASNVKTTNLQKKSISWNGGIRTFP